LLGYSLGTSRSPHLTVMLAQADAAIASLAAATDDEPEVVAR
jgi:hypothetical protein